MAGIKISNLPAATTPLAGTEQFALVQSSSTKVATITNIGDVLSDSFVTKTLYASTSGVYTTVQSSSATWDSVYSTFQSNSAEFAHENQDNCFQGTNCFTNLQAGFSNTACGSYAGVIGGYYNDACGGGSAVAGGNNNDTCANFSFIGGGDDNSICTTGVESGILGGNNNYITHCQSAIAGGTSITSVSGAMLHAQSLYLKTLPTSDPGVSGVVWNDGGTLKISS
jgi:hypothetical protein